MSGVLPLKDLLINYAIMNKLPYLQSEGFAILCYFGKMSYVGIYFGIKSY